MGPCPFENQRFGRVQPGYPDKAAHWNSLKFMLTCLFRGSRFWSEFRVGIWFIPSNAINLLEFDMKRMFQKVRLWSLQGCSSFTIGGFLIFGITQKISFFNDVPVHGHGLARLLNFLLAFSKPLMEGYMECRDGTPFLKERWALVFSESWTREIECKENRPYCTRCGLIKSL